MPHESHSNAILARRAQKDPSVEAPYYIRLYFEAQDNLWSAKNPQGNVVMSVAENKLTVDLLQAKLEATAEFPEPVFGYGDPSGDMRLKKAMVNLLHSTFLHDCTLDPANIFITGGASCLLESLFFSILDEGDGVLIPAPYYASYRFDMGFRAGGKVVAVYLDREGDLVQQLTEAKVKSENGGVPIRALIITNPDNPTGTLLPASTLTAVATWCADQELHLITNEIYGNSIYKDAPVPFASLYSIGRSLEREELKERLHLIYGLSKDFCASGVRIGILYTESQSVLERVRTPAILTAASFPTQHLMASIFQDTSFVDAFIKENKKRLRHNYETLTAVLNDAEIPFGAPQGGIFLMVDLRRALNSPNFEGEEELAYDLAKKGVFLTPGKDCRCQLPGFFRVCFATVSSDALRAAVHRIADFMRS